MDPILEQIYAMTADDCTASARHLMLGGGTRGGPVLVRGEGVRVYDPTGKSYIDCTSQSWAMYLGYANAEINRVVTEHMANLSHVHQGFDTLPRFYLARKLAQLAPGDLNRVSFTVGGGPAIEAAMKIAYKNTQPSRDFVCLYDSYHGTTLGSLGASWVSTRTHGKLHGGSRYLGLTRPFIRVPNPYCYRCPLGMQRGNCGLACARMLRMTLERGIAGNAAGVIVEPIQASGGQIILPSDYLREVRAICDEFSVPLIFDEIQTFGRIGRMFAAEYHGVTPDIIVLGKGFGAGLPLAGIIISDRLDGFQPDAEELHTFANSSVAQVAAAKQIALLEDGLLAHTAHMGEYIRAGVVELQHDFPEIGDIRAAGLHIGVEYVRDPETKAPLTAETKAIRDAALPLGVIFGLGGANANVLKIKPPLIITRAEADDVLSILREAMTQVLRTAAVR
jgi:4-aminobutyrate aminotransferase-like enzyme